MGRGDPTEAQVDEAALLDEATAALDQENEQFVQQSIGHLAQTSSVIVIAHKLSTVTAADQILGSDGAIAERRTHHSSIESGGRYAGLWHAGIDAGGWETGLALEYDGQNKPAALFLALKQTLGLFLVAADRP